MNTVYDNLPIHVASEKGNADCVRLLLEAGADIDNKNEDEQVRRRFEINLICTKRIIGEMRLRAKKIFFNALEDVERFDRQKSSSYEEKIC